MLVLNFVLLVALGASAFFFIAFVGSDEDVRWSQMDDHFCLARDFVGRHHPDRTHRIRSHSQSYTGYAYALGLISSVIIGFVWLPQIYVTYKTKVRYQHHTCALTWRFCSLLLLLCVCVSVVDRTPARSASPCC
jgi:hypothetical protein